MTHASFYFCIPGPPVPKERPRGGAPGRRAFTPKKTRAAERVIRKIAQGVTRRRDPIDGPVVVRAQFFMGDRRRRDLDNCLKLVTDALNGIAYVDDSQIVEIHAVKLIDLNHPRTQVMIEEETICQKEQTNV
jgi:crossover junction endodeoxyribonuclease RusA